MIFKVSALFGLLLALTGGILLWRSSPSGSGLSAYANADLLRQIAAQGRRMRRWQMASVTLIVVGTLLQIPLVVYG